MLRFCLVAAWCIASTSIAQERVRVAVHPLTAIGVDDQLLLKELGLETEMILAETKRLTLVSPDAVIKALADEPNGKCPPRGKERMECLERLAHATRATYAIAVHVKRLGKEYELSANVADADRVPLNQCAGVTVLDEGNVKVNAALKHQLRVLLLQQMKAGELPVDPRTRDPLPPPTIVVQPPNPDPNPPPRIVEPVEPRSNRRSLALATGIVGAAGLVTAAALFAAGAGVGSGTTNPTTGFVLADRRESFALARTLQTGSAVALSVGAALAIVAGILFFMPEDKPKVSVAPVTGGAVVGFTGVLP